MVNSKRYTGINRYRNISFHWLNWYNLGNEIDSLNLNTHFYKINKSLAKCTFELMALELPLFCF